MQSSIFMVYERLLVASASGLGGNLELLHWCPAKNRCRSVEQRPWPRAGPCRWNRGPCDRHFAWPRIYEKCSRADTPWVERKQVCRGSWWPFVWRHKRPYILNSKFKSRPDLKHKKQKKIINLRRPYVKTLGHYWPGYMNSNIKQKNQSSRCLGRSPRVLFACSLARRLVQLHARGFADLDFVTPTRNVEPSRGCCFARLCRFLRDKCRLILMDRS